MELNDVRAFVRVVDSGSVSAAARALHLTQSAVTKRLQRLEVSLGAKLFDRSQRPVGLTAAGRSAVEKCRRLLNDMSDLRAAVSNGDSATLADVRVGVSHALGEVVLTEPLGTVREEFPRYGLRLTTGSSLDLLNLVRTSALDAAIILLPEADRLPAEVLGTALGKERLVILGPRKQQARVRGIKDLEGVQWILNREGCGARAILRRELARAGIDLIAVVESATYELRLLLASQGRGLTIAPERLFRMSRSRSRLQILRVAGLHLPFTIWSVHRSSAELEPLFGRLNALLQAALAKQPR